MCCVLCVVVCCVLFVVCGVLRAVVCCVVSGDYCWSSVVCGASADVFGGRVLFVVLIAIC